MRLTQVDPRRFAAAELDALHAVAVAVQRYDEPDRRLPSHAELAGELTAPWPGTRSAFWLSWDGSEPAGSLSLVMPGGVNAGVVQVEAAVLPTKRRSGAGRQLIFEAVRMAYSCDRGQIVSVVRDGAAGEGFVRAMSGTPVHHETRAVLDVRGADTGGDPDRPREYDLVPLRGDCPPEWLPDVAAVHAGMADAPTGRSALAHVVHDVARVRDFDRMLQTRGLIQLRLLARERATGAPAGITYVIVPAANAGRSEQGDTTVLPGHRGRGLARRLKLEMLGWLRRDYPHVAELSTWVARDNQPMQALNATLGYRTVATYTHWQVSVADVSVHLGLRRPPAEPSPDPFPP